MKAPAKSHTRFAPAAGAIRRWFSVETLEARIAPAANAWIGSVSGLWTNPLNWSDGVPTADDDVTINPPGALTITIPSGSQVAASVTMAGDDTLAITGGSLTLTSASSLSNLSFSNGTLTVGPLLKLTGSTSFSGEATIAGMVRNEGAFAIAGTPNLNGTLDNAGTITSAGRLDFGAAGRLNNLAGGIFEAAVIGGGSVAGGGATVPGFFNAGTFRLAQAGSTSFGAAFNSQPGGTVEVTSGTLSLTGGGTWDGANLQIAEGAAVTLTSGTMNLTGLLTGTGQGVFRLGGGTQGASDGGILSIGAGGLTVNFPNGRFEFSGNATIAGGTLLNQGVMTILDRPDLKATLDNAGTVRHSARLDMSDTARINNLSGGVYEILGVLDGIVAAGTGLTPGFFNSGTVRHAAAAPSTFNVNFSNLSGGVIEGVSSELAFNRNGTWGDTNFLISPGAEVTLSGGVVNWAGTYTGSGGGLLRLGRGTQGASEGGHVTVGAAGATFNFPAGFFEFSGNATLDGGAVKNLGQITIDGRPDLGGTLDNAGTITIRGQLDVGVAGQINNQVGGVLEIARVGGGTVAAGGAASAITNAGTIRLAEAGVSTIATPFDNRASGVIEVTAGSLALHSDGTWEGANFLISSGSVVTLNAGDKVWSGTYTGSGGGILRLGGGTQGASAGGHIAAGAAGATFNFPSGFFEFSGNASLDGGEVNNLGEITFIDRPNFGTTINNTGKIINRATIDFGAAGRIDNQVGGVLEIAKVGGGTVAAGGSASAITNAGTIRLAEVGVSTLATPFDNRAGGVIEVTAGTLALHSAGTWEGASFQIAAGAQVTLNAGSRVWSGIYAGFGGGTLRLGGGSQGIGAGGTVTIAPAGAMFDFPAGFFSFADNASLGGGTVTNLGEFSMSVRPNLTATIENFGTIVNTAGIDFGEGGRINNRPTGTINIANTANGTFASGSDAVGIFNEGTFLLTTDFNLATSVPFSNTGLVRAVDGILRITGAVAEIVNGVLTDGTWEAENGASLLISRPFSTNEATLIQRGRGVIGGIGAGLTTNHGTIQLLDASSLTLTQDFTNSGRLVIDSGSLLTTAGAFSQTAAGRTEFVLGGTQASGNFGRLAVGGTATLDGTAAFVREEGFTPQIGDSFPLATFGGKSGDFASYEGKKINRNLYLSPVVEDTSFVVSVAETPANTKPLDQKTPVSFTDANGDSVSIKLKGPGSARVILLGEAVDNADIDFIDITGSTDKTSIKVAVKKKAGGNGFVSVGSIDATGVNLKTVSIKGDLGQIVAGDGSGKPAVKTLSIAGDFGSDNGVATFSQLSGGVKKISVGGAFDGGSLQIDGAVGSVTIRGDFNGTPVGVAASDVIGISGIAGIVAQGGTTARGILLAESIRSLKIGGSVKSGAIETTKELGAVSIFGDFAGSLFSGEGMKSVKVVGKVTGEDPMQPATITPRTKLDSLIIGGDVENARILVGYDKDAQPVNSDAQVRKVVVKGDWISSSLVVGIQDSTDDGFGRNDVLIAADTTPSVSSTIASLTIKGSASGSPVAGDHFGITAQQIGRVKIGGTNIALSKDGTDNLLLDETNSDFRLVEIS